jgi:hypothetical protein
MSEDILAQFMEPKPDPHVVPATQPVEEQTEQERRAQEARDYLASLPQAQKQRTEEEMQAIRNETLASVPMVDGKPIPESGTLTQEQMRNNPSNYQPAIEPFIEQASVSSETIEMGIIRDGQPGYYQPDIEASRNSDAIVVGGVDAKEKARVKPEAPPDNRQWWVCVQSDGIRTMDNKGVVHPAFQSDVHLMDVMVRCPVCDSTSVRKVLDGEDLQESVNRAAWTRERTKVMGLNPILRA